MANASSEKEILASCLQSLDPDKLAEEAGWSLKSRKVRALEWCLALCLASARKAPSLRVAAHFMGLVGALSVSRQAMHKRLRRGGASLIGKALEAAVAAKAHCAPAAAPGGFARVLIQDSTTVALPDALRYAYPGASNQAGGGAAMKIQAVYDMAGNRFASFSLGAFTRNDQAAAGDILEVARPGDLALRDLGYFTLDSLRRIDGAGAFFLSRLKGGVKLHDPATGEEIDLNALLRGKATADVQVLAGTKERLPVRLVAVALSEQVANARRRRAKGNRDRRLSPSKRSLELLGWQVMLTNCSEELLPAAKACEIYAMRWRIETVFKSWKSGLGLGGFAQRASAAMAEALVQAALLRVTLVHAVLVPWLEARDPTRRVSVVKLMDLLDTSAGFAADGPEACERILESVSRHCRYEKRSKRANTLERWDRLVSDMEELS